MNETSALLLVLAHRNIFARACSTVQDVRQSTWIRWNVDFENIDGTRHAGRCAVRYRPSESETIDIYRQAGVAPKWSLLQQTTKTAFSPNAESISISDGGTRWANATTTHNFCVQLTYKHVHLHESQFTISITSDANRAHSLSQNVATNKCVMVDYQNQIPPPDGSVWLKWKVNKAKRHIKARVLVATLLTYAVYNTVKL